MAKKKFVATVVVTVEEEDGRTVSKGHVIKALREGDCRMYDKNFFPVGHIDKISVRSIDID